MSQMLIASPVPTLSHFDPTGTFQPYNLERHFRSLIDMQSLECVKGLMPSSRLLGRQQCCVSTARKR